MTRSSLLTYTGGKCGKYTVVFGAPGFVGVLRACACNRYQAAFFPSPSRPGYEARVRSQDYTIEITTDVRSQTSHAASYQKLVREQKILAILGADNSRLSNQYYYCLY